jgi:hypothetical protein
MVTQGIRMAWLLKKINNLFFLKRVSGRSSILKTSPGYNLSKSFIYLKTRYSSATAIIKIATPANAIGRV